MDFKDLSSLALFVAGIHKHEEEALQKALEKCAARIEKTAKAEIGHYQPAVGRFPGWAALADSTEADKARKGFQPDAPLERTGQFRDSITHEIHGLEAIIGSKDERAPWFEFGTPKMPPRQVFGPALERNRGFINKIIGKYAVSAFSGGDRVHPDLGYDE